MSHGATNTLPCYRVDGRHVATDVALPLPPVEAGSRPDWTIEIAREPVPFEDDAVAWTGDVSQDTGRWGRFGRWQGRACVRLEGLFDLVADVEGGRAALHHDRGVDADAALLRHALPYLAALQRRLVLHAASVVLPEGAVLLCGEAGTGKSTLAMALDARGYAALGDDHVALEQGEHGARAFASLPTIDTLPASRQVFFAERAHHAGKVSAPCRTPRPARAVPVHRIVFLERGERAAPERTPRAEVVRRLMLDVLFVGDPADGAEQATRFEDAVRLARTVPAYTVTLPDGLQRLADDLGRVIDDLRGPGRPGPAAPPPDARLDLTALVWVSAIRAALWVLPLARVRALVTWMARVGGPTRRTVAPAPHAVGRAIRRTTRTVPRATCLVQSLAAQGLLTRWGHEADLHLAASRGVDGALAAHAWVECDGHAVVGDGPGPHTPLGRVPL